MRISDLSEHHFQRYYEARLADKRLRRSGAQLKALCPFHPDENPSLSVNVSKGVWNCFACNQGGGVLAFEKLFSNCDDRTAVANISEIIGEKQLMFRTPPEKTHVYHDANGEITFRVLRIGSGKGKAIWQEIPDGKGGWIKEGAREKVRGLYRLPEVVTARHVMFVEGEKNADDVRAALEKAGTLGIVTGTTSPLGAGKYCDEYSPYFTGKNLLIYPDNDEPGRKHAQQVAASAFRYANAVKIVELPGLPEKGDISDFFEEHSFEEVVAITKATPWWRPESSTFAVPYDRFEATAPDHIEWLIEGLIQRGSNGMLIARPKAGKSFAFLDMAIALASGQKWLDFFVPRPLRVLFVSREDNPQTTKDRGRKLCAGRGLGPNDLAGWLWLNTREQTPQLMLSDAAQVAEVIATAKQEQVELIMLDVLRVLHEKNENSNTEMQEILQVLNRVRDETGAAIALAHHARKAEDDDTLTEMARGAGALSGWTEWLGCIRVVDEIERVRRFESEIKAAMSPDPFYWKITPMDEWPAAVKLQRVEYETLAARKYKSRKSSEQFDPESN